MTLPLMSKKKYVSVLSFFKNNADITGKTDNVTAKHFLLFVLWRTNDCRCVGRLVKSGDQLKPITETTTGRERHGSDMISNM